MNDADPVGGGQRVDDLAGRRDGLVDGHGALGVESGRAGSGLPQLHHEVDDAVLGVAEIRDVDDVGMADLVDRLGFLEEARNQPRIGAEIRAQHLHRHPLANHGVLGQVDRPHAAFADARTIL